MNKKKLFETVGKGLKKKRAGEQDSDNTTIDFGSHGGEKNARGGEMGGGLRRTTMQKGGGKKGREEK